MKPVPHRACGSEPTVIDGDGYFVVECSECHQSTDLYGAAEDAILAWNGMRHGVMTAKPIFSYDLREAARWLGETVITGDEVSPA